MPTLYNLTNEMEKLYNDLLSTMDEETGEIDEKISNALAVKEEEFNSKAIAVATVTRRFRSTEEEIDAEIKRLKAMKERVKHLGDRLENSLSMACDRLGKTKIDGISATISFRQSEATIVENEEQLPEQFFDVEMKKKVSLTRIKQAIKSGLIVPGARLETRKNIQIK